MCFKKLSFDGSKLRDKDEKFRTSCIKLGNIESVTVKLKSSFNYAVNIASSFSKIASEQVIQGVRVENQEFPKKKLISQKRLSLGIIKFEENRLEITSRIQICKKSVQFRLK